MHSEPDRSYIVMQNWTQPGKNIGNTSVYRFHVGAHVFLLDDLERESAHFLARYNNSQTYISREIGDGLHFWPDAWCQLFKVQCVPSWPARFWKEPIIPDGCRVVAFPGVPNPHDAVAGQWPDKKGKSTLFGLRRLYKYVRPTQWIKDIWLDAEKSLP